MKRGEVEVITNESRRPTGAGPYHGLAQRSRVAARLLEEMLRSMVDDELHPAVEHVYAALCEAETRAAATGGVAREAASTMLHGPGICYGAAKLC